MVGSGMDIMQRCCGLVLAGTLFHSSCFAMGLSLDDVVPNFFGIGAGSTPEWNGADDAMVGAVPGARYSFGKGKFVEWYGPYLGANVVEESNWEAGPVLNVRLGRSDVTDPVVSSLPDIGLGLEAGGYVGWHHMNVHGVPYRFRTGLMAVHAVIGQTEGANVTPYVSLWVPLSAKLFVGLGGGATWADGAFMQQFYGVSEASASVSGLPAFQAGSGWRQTYLWPAIMWRVSPQWMVGAGVYYQYLLGDAADSPIVAERGDRQQLSGGLGIGYLW